MVRFYLTCRSSAEITINSNSDMSCDEQQLLTSVPFVGLSDMSQEDRETLHMITAALDATEGDDHVEGSVTETEKKESAEEPDCVDEWLIFLLQSEENK